MKKRSRFNCTQSELYAVCSHAWENCSANLARFTAFKKKYSPEFVKARQADISKVLGMHDQAQRAGFHERKRLALKEQVGQCLTAWKRLKAHIRDAWEGAEQESYIRSAGLAYYADTYKLKWEACLSLMSSAEIFVRDNSARLLAGNNMDAGFSAELSVLKDGFSDLYRDYLNSTRENEQLAAEKLSANNGLYKDMIDMFTDAKVIFGKEPELHKQFVFDSVLLQVSGRSSSGIKGKVSNGQLSPGEIKGLLLLLLENGDTVSVNGDGSYRFSQISSGTYTLQVSAPGYREQRIPGIEVHAGSYTIQNIVLQKDAGPVA